MERLVAADALKAAIFDDAQDLLMNSELGGGDLVLADSLNADRPASTGRDRAV